MIDCHCHLEQKDYEQEREKVIEQCKKELKAIVTCCAHPRDLPLTLKLVKENKNFIFCSIGIHPEHIKEISDEEISNTIKEIEKNVSFITAIGETGLDYYWIKESKFREKQREMFIKFIALAKKLGKPLVIHSRDATKECIEILEQEGIQGKRVLMHLFSDRKLLVRVIENGWLVSIGPGIKKSKDIRKVARDMPLNKILLETDSPWFAQKEQGQKYGTPLNARIALEKIAEIKRVSLEEVEKQTDLNAIEFFNLEIK
ncbi:MAG: TatD family hydrolase [Candidatus Pacearchaeota archaeon]